MSAVANITINPKKTPVVKGSVAKQETSKKGGVETSVTRYRLPETFSGFKTSKDVTDYGISGGLKFDHRADIQWLANNQDLGNVVEWFDSIYSRVNAKIVAEAGAAGLDAGLLLDIESLVGFETLESARGRKATRLDGDQWKFILTALSSSVKSGHSAKHDAAKLPALTNHTMGIIRACIVLQSPSILGEPIKGFIDAVFVRAMEDSRNEYCLDTLALAHTYWETWKENNSPISEDAY